MHILFSALLFMMMAYDSKAETDSASASADSPVEVNLSELRWEKRVLLIFTDDVSNPDFGRQMQLLESDPEGLEIRKLVRFILPENGASAAYENQPLSSESAAQIRNRYADERPFTFILIGKDGGEKLRSHEVVEIEDLFAIIDRMPMRAREIRQDQR